MTRVDLRLPLIAVLAAAGALTAAPGEVIAVRGPTIVAFFPATQDEIDRDPDWNACSCSR